MTGLDKQVGRGYQLKSSPLKEKAQELDIEVLQFNKVSKEGIDKIKELSPDVVVTAAFGQILSDEFLAIPKYGVLNVHASLLPKYRGASPIQWSILNGDKTTGITIMKTVKSVDAGAILLQKEIEILPKETAGELFDRLSLLGGEAIVEAISKLKSGKAKFVEQDHSKASHCSMIKKSDGQIDFCKDYKQIDCFIRAMSPWPSAYTKYNNKSLKIFEITKISDNSKYACGEIIKANAKDGLLVACKNSILRLNTIQLEGSKKMSDCDFLKGRKFDIGYIFE